jgi:hypothetical protein
VPPRRRPRAGTTAEEDDVIQAADIREWRDRDLVDPEGHKIGVLEAVYVDTSTDRPAMATVRMGLPTRQRLAFVPLDDVTLGPDYVRVAYAKARVKKAPSLGTDDVLPADAERSVFEYYDLTYRPSAEGERQLARR